MNDYAIEIHTARSDGLRMCADCQEEKPATTECFYRRTRSNGRVYLTSCCKECIKARRKIYRTANPEKVRDANRRNRLRNGRRHNAARRERLAASSERRERKRRSYRRWYRQNIDKVRLYTAAYNSSNKELKAERDKRWRQENPMKVKANVRAYRARRQGAGGRFTEEDVTRRMVLQCGRCYWCKERLNGTFHQDHFIPVAMGGSNNPSNIVLACPTCNTSRGKKSPGEFLDYLRFVEANAEKIERRRAYMASYMRDRRQARRP